jgi:uncharacterized protein (TIGR03083 family)
MSGARDPERPGRLLLGERDALFSILADISRAAFDRPTVLPSWSVRDVLAHCGSALSRAGNGTMHSFTPELNQIDVDERRTWPLASVLNELRHGYGSAVPVIAAAEGALDGLALGEWLHGGDVRDALGVESAYASEGIEDALALIVERSRQPHRNLPATRVLLGDQELRLGADGADGAATVELSADVATFVRLCGGRSPDPTRFTVTGAEPDRYIMFS